MAEEEQKGQFAGLRQDQPLLLDDDRLRPAFFTGQAIERVDPAVDQGIVRPARGGVKSQCGVGRHRRVGDQQVLIGRTEQANTVQFVLGIEPMFGELISIGKSHQDKATGGLKHSDGFAGDDRSLGPGGTEQVRSFDVAGPDVVGA